MSNRRKLGEILVANGHLGAEQVEHALTQQKERRPPRRLGQVLVEQGAVDEITVARALAQQLTVPYVDPLTLEVDSAVLWKVPRKVAEARRVLVYARLQRGYKAVMADPRDGAAITDLEFMLGGPVLPEVGAEGRVLRAIHRHYDLEPQAQRMLQDVPAAFRAPVVSPATLELDAPLIEKHLQKGGTGYVELLNFLLVNAIERGASDIHMEPEPTGMRIRFRIDGMLREVLQLPRWAIQPISTRVKVVGRMDITESRRPQDGRASAELGRRAVDLRLSTIPSQFGEAVVIRILDSATLKVDLASLGWSPKGLAAYFQMVSQAQGLILVVGPTGSGKTTTLYASINRLRGEAASIVTVEDPIEHTIAGVRQVQVDEKSGLTFASATRSLLRQDPNVMVIGEIRDAESAGAAVDAATTGHLVLSTLHTGHSISALTRLRDLGVPNYLAGHAILGVVSQRLLRKVCPECSILRAPDAEDWERLGIDPEPMGAKVREVGAGCPTCQYTGYSGRIGAFEVLRITEPLRALILHGASEAELSAEARAGGFVSMLEDALDKVREGQTTLEEVARLVPVDPWRGRRSRPAARGSEAAETSAVQATGLAASVTAEPGGQAAPELGAVVRKRSLVLVVDDAEEIRLLIGATLEDDYDLVYATDGVEALEAVAAHNPDVVVLDVMMPRLSGYEACKQLKDDPKTADLPVLILSARGDTAHIKQGFHAGADDYLPKPFDPEELELRLRALLRRSVRRVTPA